MTLSRMRKLMLVALCGGTLLQTGGCESIGATLAASIIPQLVIALLSGFLGV